MRTTTTTLLIAAAIALSAAPLLVSANVTIPTGSATPGDQCAAMNNAFSPQARCVRVQAGTSYFYAYALSTNLNSPAGCKIHAAAPSGSLPSMGVFEESNGQAGLQTDFATGDKRHFATCTPWGGP